jgi:hypothetical protein
MRSMFLATIGLLIASAASSAHARDVAPQPSLEETSSRGGVQIFTDQTTFDAAIVDPTALVVETFDGGATPDGLIYDCEEPVSSTSDDESFDPGQLVAGFAITSSASSGVVTIGAGRFGAGQTSTIIGAQAFAVATIVTFEAPVNAVSLDLYDVRDALEITIEAFDRNGMSLGTAATTPPAVDIPAFIGVISVAPIARVEVSAADGSSEQIDNLRFVVADIVFRDGFDDSEPRTTQRIAGAPSSVEIDSSLSF